MHHPTTAPSNTILDSYDGSPTRPRRDATPAVTPISFSGSPTSSPIPPTKRPDKRAATQTDFSEEEEEEEVVGFRTRSGGDRASRTSQFHLQFRRPKRNRRIIKGLSDDEDTPMLHSEESSGAPEPVEFRDRHREESAQPEQVRSSLINSAHEDV